MEEQLSNSHWLGRAICDHLDKQNKNRMQTKMHTQNSWNNGSSFGLVISCNAQYPNPTNSGECEITTDHIWTLCVLKIFKNLLIAHPSGSKRNCTHKNLKWTCFLPLLPIYPWSRTKNSPGLLLIHVGITEWVKLCGCAWVHHPTWKMLRWTSTSGMQTASDTNYRYVN